MIALQNLSKKWIAIGLVVALAVVAVLTWLGPVEKVLGENLRLVLLHGAWVWAGKIAFALSGLAGLLYLASAAPGSMMLRRHWRIPVWFFWLTYPYRNCSHPADQLGWNCLAGTPFPDSPCFWGGGGFAANCSRFVQHPLADRPGQPCLCLSLVGCFARAENFLHPNSPVFGGNSVRIQSPLSPASGKPRLVGMLDGTVISSKKNYQSAGDQMNNNYGETPRGSLMRQVVLFTLVRVVFHTAYRMVYPFLSAFGRGLGVDVATISVALTGRSLVGIAGPFLAPLADSHAGENSPWCLAP